MFFDKGHQEDANMKCNESGDQEASKTPPPHIDVSGWVEREHQNAHFFVVLILTLAPLYGRASIGYFPAAGRSPPPPICFRGGGAVMGRGEGRGGGGGKGK